MLLNCQRSTDPATFDNAAMKTGMPLRLLSVIIPVRDEEGCIASTVEHLHLELWLRGVPHEIIVVDDGSFCGQKRGG
jgi:hypothetical protein